MRRLCGFKTWVVESTLQEAVLQFGKHRGQNADEVPWGYWKWLAGEFPKFTNVPRVLDDDGRPMSREQISDLIKSKLAYRGKKAAPAAQAPREEPPMVAPQEPERRQTVEPPAPTKSLSKEPWILATVTNLEGLEKGEHVVVTKAQDGNWIAMTRNGATRRIPASEIRTAVASVRHEGKPLMAQDPEELWSTVPAPAISASKPEEPQQASGGNPHILDDKKLSEEQREIDRDFEKMIVSPRQNHMMINALAGTGKTTILKHLAWKYGNDNQHWLYLVFNAKNRAEAKETSGGFRKFPEWVQIYTTNSFLGHVLGDKGNRGVIPSTERLLSLAKGDVDSGSKKLEKARIIVDSSEFAKIMTNDYHLPDWEQVKEDVPRIMRRLGVKVEYSKPGAKKKTFYEVCESTLEFTVDSIRKNFKERVLTLLGLLKSFAVDPRKRDTLREQVRKVFDKYDVAVHEDGEREAGFFDTHLEDVKERIDNYSDRFKDLILDALHEILHYDFMGKNYKEEVIGAATWMLEKALPKGTDQRWQRKDAEGRPVGRPVNLGDYRDFNDDIWFPTIFSDKLKWPHYDVVLANEVQDFNEGQKVMLKKLAEAGAKIVAVGDPNQAIYRFRGADNDAFNNLAEMLKDASHDKTDWKPKSLSLNFRSRPEVLQYANDRTHVKDLKAGKKFKEDDLAPEVTHEKIKYDESFDMIAKERSAGKLIETAYISRTNQPLVSAALKLLGLGVPFAIIGKDVSGDLINHIKKIIDKEKKRGMNDGTSVLMFKDSLNEFHDDERSKKFKYSTQKDYLANLKDTTVALVASIDAFTKNGQQDGTIRDFKKWLGEKLGNNSFDWDQSDEEKSEADLRAYKEKLEKEKPVILTTAHKSKGLEFARVFILRNDQFPHPRAKHPEELGQEDNTKYVAFTRAMHQLHNLNPEGQPGYEADHEKNPTDEDYE